MRRSASKGAMSVFFYLSLVGLGVVLSKSAPLSTAVPADYKVTGLDMYGADDSMFSGYMPINIDKNDEGSYFFWLAEMRGKTPENPGPLVVWLNGAFALKELSTYYTIQQK